MDSLSANVVFHGGVPLIANGRMYTVKALPIADIITEDFAKCGLHIPADGEPVNDWQAVRLEDERYRDTLNRWLNSLVTLNGEPMSLELIAAYGWTDKDIGAFLSLVLQSSGLTRKPSTSTEPTTTQETWLDVLTEFQYHLHRSWSEVTAMPLMQLNALRERVLKHAVSNSVPGLLGTITGGNTAQSGGNAHTFKTRQEYEAFLKDAGTGGDPRMGKTPQFKTRDEYFAEMARLRG